VTISHDNYAMAPPKASGKAASSFTLVPDNGTGPTAPSPGHNKTIEISDIETLTEAELDNLLAQKEKELALKKKRKRLVALMEQGASDSEEEAEPKKKKSRPSKVFTKATLAPLKYHGKSRSDLNAFLVDLRARFHLAGDELKNPTTRVIYASSGFEGRAKRQWATHVAQAYHSDPTRVPWEAFEIWLRNGVSDEVNL
jgi:hypothetical protein